MSLPRLPIMPDILAIISGSSSILVWQEQLDWGLRIAATLVAVAAGGITIYQRLRKHA